MMYWEHHNPRFLSRLHDPLEIDYDRWLWEEEEWLLSGNPMEDYTFVFSPPASIPATCQKLRSILANRQAHVDFLALYYYVEGLVRVSVLGTEDSRLLHGLNIQAPEWWSIEEDLTPLQRLRERIQVLMGAVSKYQKTTRPRHLESRVNGFCSFCGLPDDRHVPHGVPGFEGKTVPYPSEDYRVYVAAFRQHYGGALKQLSNIELQTLPLPPSRRYLRALLSEVQSRIDPPKLPIRAIDRILAGDLLNE